MKEPAGLTGPALCRLVSRLLPVVKGCSAPGGGGAVVSRGGPHPRARGLATGSVLRCGEKTKSPTET